MMLKKGVNPLGMRPEIMIAAIVANEVYALQGHNLVITSITDGKHGDDSYHYKGLAIDIRTHYFASQDEIIQVASAIASRLGFCYDVVIESDHIHVEFDERKAQS
jgi:hypothetical protein